MAYKRLPLILQICAALGLEESANSDAILAAIEELKSNQKLPDYTLGKHKDICPHGRPLNVQCPECK